MADLQEAAREFYRAALAKTEWTPYKLAQAAGIAATTITRPLNDPKYKFVPKLETIGKIAAAAGMEPPDALKALPPGQLTPVAGSIPVVGTVRAGSWEMIPEEPVIEEWLPMDVPEYAGASLFAVRVVGRSMDLIYPDGTYVIAIPPQEAGLRVGDRVVVRRYDATGRAETTLKEIANASNGRLVLEPRSSDPLHQLPIIVPIGDDHTDIGVEIIGVVVASYSKERRGTGPLLR